MVIRMCTYRVEHRQRQLHNAKVASTVFQAKPTCLTARALAADAHAWIKHAVHCRSALRHLHCTDHCKEDHGSMQGIASAGNGANHQTVDCMHSGCTGCTPDTGYWHGPAAPRRLESLEVIVR